MTLARLLALTLLVCSLPAFTQDQQTGLLLPGNSVVVPYFDLNRPAAATPSEPWRIIPKRPSDLSSDSVAHLGVDRYRWDQGKVDFPTGPWKLEAATGTRVSGLDGQLDADTTCYAIRSYVVALDSKDSDSTHPAGYSTCRPASRYHLKSAQERTGSRNR
jgi:hypothetical protein